VSGYRIDYAYTEQFSKVGEELIYGMKEVNQLLHFDTAKSYAYATPFDGFSLINAQVTESKQFVISRHLINEVAHAHLRCLLVGTYYC
jgi:hypothetical protein